MIIACSALASKKPLDGGHIHIGDDGHGIAGHCRQNLAGEPAVSGGPFDGFARFPLGFQLRVKRKDQPVAPIGTLSSWPGRGGTGRG